MLLFLLLLLQRLLLLLRIVAKILHKLLEIRGVSRVIRLRLCFLVPLRAALLCALQCFRGIVCAVVLFLFLQRFHEGVGVLELLLVLLGDRLVAVLESLQVLLGDIADTGGGFLDGETFEAFGDIQAGVLLRAGLHDIDVVLHAGEFGVVDGGLFFLVALRVHQRFLRGLHGGVVPRVASRRFSASTTLPDSCAARKAAAACSSGVGPTGVGVGVGVGVTPPLMKLLN